MSTTQVLRASHTQSMYTCVYVCVSLSLVWWYERNEQPRKALKFYEYNTSPTCISNSE